MSKQKILAIDDSPTILKILEVILKQAGYEVLLAHDGLEGIRIAKEKKPDLIVLDFIMPKMNGFQVGKAIRKDEELKDIPLILMSAKGDKVGHKFVDMMGAMDYLTKPFSPESLLSLIPRSLKHAEETAAKAAAASPEAKTEPKIIPIEKKAAPLTPEEEILSTLRDVILSNVGSVADLILKAQAGKEVVEIIGDVLSESLNSEVFDIIKKKLEKLEAPSIGDGISMKGLLNQVPLPEVFQFAKFQSHTGLLRVTGLEKSAAVFMDGGTVALATFSDPDSDDFNKKIFEGSALDEYTIKKAVNLAVSSNSTVTDTIVREKIWDRKSLYNFLDSSTREVIFEILTWQQGSFSFHIVKEHAEEVKSIDLGIMIDQLVMDGLRKLDEYSIIKKCVHSDSQVFVRNNTVPIDASKLTNAETRVLPLIDGTKNIMTIKNMLKISTFDLSKAIYHLLNEGYVREITTDKKTANK